MESQRDTLKFLIKPRNENGELDFSLVLSGANLLGGSFWRLIQLQMGFDFFFLFS